MESRRGEDIRSVFLEALALPADRRSRFLEERCAGDDELRREVQSLLGHEPRASSFLETPAVRMPSVVANLQETSPTREKPGDRIGSFELVRVLGEGSFGTVWLAERSEPFKQQVALKIIKPGMDSRAVLSRFEHERRALALMDHPNIATVLDGGVLAWGHPYFVMEYVDGEPITTACDRLGHSTRQRLELFVSVCEAVQHAHQKGVIHRDLKPSNILVAVKDGQPVAKVIDFGVAKALDQTVIERTVFTELGQLVGTPEYMSPEQADPGTVDIDTRADVYSLGVVLYELLSGLLPFDSKELRSKGYGEIQRIIREVDPPTPSKRLAAYLVSKQATRATLATSQSARQAVPLEVHQPASEWTGRVDSAAALRELRRELEWIPLRAMRKDRDRRYASAIDIANDIRRFLKGEALDAAPENALYLLRKFARRNVALLVACLAILFSIGLVIAFVFKAKIDRFASEASEQQNQQAQDLATSMLDAFTKQSTFGADERLPQTIDEVFEAWRAGIERTKFNNPLTEGFVRLAVAQAAKDRPEFIEFAVAQANKGILAYQQAGASGVPTSEQYLILAEVLYSNDQHIKEAESAFTLAAETASAALKSSPNNMKALASWSRANTGLASAIVSTSAVLNDPSIPDRAAFAKADPRWQQSLALLKSTVKEVEQRRGTDDESFASVLSLLGELLRTQGDTQEAQLYVDRSLKLLEERYPASEELPTTLTYAARLAMENNDQPRARALFERCVALKRQRHAHNHPMLKDSLKDLAQWHTAHGDPNDAIPLRAEHFECARRESKFEAASSAVLMAGTLLAAQRYSEAESWYRRADEEFLTQEPSFYAKRATRRNILIAMAKQGRWPDAVRDGTKYYTADSNAAIATAMADVYRDWNAKEPSAEHASLEKQWRDLAERK